MIGRKVSLPPFLRSLSARLLVLTVIFVMVSEVLIFVPSVARFRLNYLQQHIADAHLAMLALEATPDNMVSQELANELLVHVGAHGIVLHKPNNTTLMIDAETPPDVAATYDLRQAGFFGLIRDAMMTLAEKGNYVIRVLDVSPTDPRLVVEVLLDEAPMRREMWAAPAHRQHDAVPRRPRGRLARHRAVEPRRRDRPRPARARLDAGDGAPGLAPQCAPRRARHRRHQGQP